MAVMFFYGSRLGQIKGFALGDSFDDVHQNDITQLLFSQSLGGGSANIAGPDYGNSFIHDTLLLHLCFKNLIDGLEEKIINNFCYNVNIIYIRVLLTEDLNIG
jgi:hypothetical protein